MARPKKEKLTLAEQLEIVEKELAECESKSKELKEKRKNLNKQIAEELKEQLYDTAVKSGLSIEDCMGLIKEKAQKKTEMQ